MRALGMAMGRRGFGYVMALTLVVTLAGAAGMHAFERDSPDGTGLLTYGAALWWTAMIITTMGSDYWPRSPEGRILCLALSVYSLGVLLFEMTVGFPPFAAPEPIQIFDNITSSHLLEFPTFLDPHLIDLIRAYVQTLELHTNAHDFLTRLMHVHIER